MDRLELRHRRAHHPGDLRLRFGAALRRGVPWFRLLGPVLHGDLTRRKGGRPLAAAICCLSTSSQPFKETTRLCKRGIAEAAGEARIAARSDVIMDRPSANAKIMERGA